MAKKTQTVNSTQSTLFDIPAIKQVKEEKKKTLDVIHSVDIPGLGINSGNFSDYIKIGRNNNLNWGK